MRILIAEDDPTAREINSLLIARAGHEVVAVADGAAAVAALLAGGFGAALLDLRMPLMDGAEVARAVTIALPEGSRPRLIALTADAGPGSEASILALGFDACLAKPLRLPALAAALTGDRVPLAALVAPPRLSRTGLNAGPLLEAHTSGDLVALMRHTAALRAAAAAEHPMLADLCARLEQALALGDSVSAVDLVAAIADQTGRA